MAKPTAPLLSFGAEGTLAKTMVFSKWKGRPYVRRYVIPANPNTTAQQSTRDAFRTANSFWKSAPTLFVAPWTRFATGQVLTNRNAFVGRFVKDLRGLATMATITMSPGAKGGLAADSVALVGAAGTATATFVNPAPPTGWTLDGAVAAALLDADPATATVFGITAAEDVTAPMDTVALTGLAAGTYVVAGWLRWLKPDATVAYGPSLVGTVVVT